MALTSRRLQHRTFIVWPIFVTGRRIDWDTPHRLFRRICLSYFLTGQQAIEAGVYISERSTCSHFSIKTVSSRKRFARDSAAFLCSLAQRLMLKTPWALFRFESRSKDGDWRHDIPIALTGLAGWNRFNHGNAPLLTSIYLPKLPFNSWDEWWRSVNWNVFLSLQSLIPGTRISEISRLSNFLAPGNNYP